MQSEHRGIRRGLTIKEIQRLALVINSLDSFNHKASENLTLSHITSANPKISTKILLFLAPNIALDEAQTEPFQMLFFHPPNIYLNHCISSLQLLGMTQKYFETSAKVFLFAKMIFPLILVWLFLRTYTWRSWCCCSSWGHWKSWVKTSTNPGRNKQRNRYSSSGMIWLLEIKLNKLSKFIWYNWYYFILPFFN